MEQKELLEVKILSKETVKPSLPPPSHPTTFTLSLLDQIFPVVNLVPVLLFYTATASTPPGGGRVHISGLKHSLSRTLDCFYPLAGRLQDESTISCHDQGVPYVGTIVDWPLSYLLSSPHKLKLLTKLFPSPELVPLAIQVNVFSCDGVGIGCYFSHKLMDGISFGTFLKHWATLSSKRFEELIQPNFEAPKIAFPPLPTLDQVFINPDLIKSNLVVPCSETHDHHHIHPKVVVKSFVFYNDSISKLKAKATSERVPKPTRFEALAGFIWEQNLAAANNANDKVTQLLFHVDMRSRMNPPLPRGSMGNLFVPHVQAQTDITSSSLQDLVEVIHSALINVTRKISTVYQGENGPQVCVSERKAELLHAMNNEEESRDSQFRISSWCNMGLNDANFGFGKPVWVVPSDGTQPPPYMRNVFFLTDYSHPVAGDGIEAWLFLEENDMNALESNAHFQALVFPN